MTSMAGPDRITGWGDAAADRVMLSISIIAFRPTNRRISTFAPHCVHSASSRAETALIFSASSVGVRIPFRCRMLTKATIQRS